MLDDVYAIAAFDTFRTDVRILAVTVDVELKYNPTKLLDPVYEEPPSVMVKSSIREFGAM